MQMEYSAATLRWTASPRAHACFASTQHALRLTAAMLRRDILMYLLCTHIRRVHDQAGRQHAVGALMSMPRMALS